VSRIRPERSLQERGIGKRLKDAVSENTTTKNSLVGQDLGANPPYPKFLRGIDGVLYQRGGSCEDRGDKGGFRLGVESSMGPGKWSLRAPGKGYVRRTKTKGRSF